jgi:HK97 family phage major capsid protein
MATIETLVAHFDTFEGELRAALDKQSGEIEKYGKSTEETGKQIDKITAALQDIGEELKEVQTNVRAMETNQNRPGMPGSDEDRRSVGARFAQSEEIKAMAKSSAMNSGPVDVGSFFGPRAIDSGSGSAGVLVEPERVPGIITPPRQGFTLRQLLNVRPTTSNSIEYIRQTGFTNNAAPVAEGAVKPQSVLTFDRRTAPIEVIAHWAQITRQIVADAPRLQTIVEGELKFGLELKEEAQFLRGNGSSPNLQGIMTDPAVQNYAWSDGKVGDTKIDALRRAMLKGRKAKYPATGIVLSLEDKADIDTLKGSDGHYIWVNVVDTTGMRLWGLPVVESDSLVENEFVVGAFGLGATVWDREETTVRITDSHADYFIYNKLVVLVEERVGITIERPEAFVIGNFDNEPVAP